MPGMTSATINTVIVGHSESELCDIARYPTFHSYVKEKGDRLNWRRMEK